MNHEDKFNLLPREQRMTAVESLLSAFKNGALCKCWMCQKGEAYWHEYRDRLENEDFNVAAGAIDSGCS